MFTSQVITYMWFIKQSTQQRSSKSDKSDRHFAKYREIIIFYHCCDVLVLFREVPFPHTIKWGYIYDVQIATLLPITGPLLLRLVIAIAPWRRQQYKYIYVYIYYIYHIHIYNTIWCMTLNFRAHIPVFPFPPSDTPCVQLTLTLHLLIFPKKLKNNLFAFFCHFSAL